MSTHEIIPRDPIEHLAGRAHAYADASKAESTRRAYQADWRDFVEWADWRQLTSLPAEPSTVALYLTALAEAGKRASTLQRRRAAIAFAHQLAGHESPTRTALVEEVMAGIRREIGVAQQGKAPVLTPDIRAMVTLLPGDLRGVRDRALILLGFAGAFRRSELVALNIDDVEECAEGLRITIRRGKTDQEGVGRLVGIPRGEHPETCPVRAVQSWLHASGVCKDALFRGISSHGKVLGRLSDRGVARVVKHAAEVAGLNPESYSGHSLRAGLATSAAMAGVHDRDIMAQTGHKRVETLYKYIRRGNLFHDNAASKLGL